MVNKKLDKQDIDFILKKASEGVGVTEIQKLLLEERNVDIKSRQTFYKVLKENEPTPVQQPEETKPETLIKPISRELKTEVEKPKAEEPTIPRNESSSLPNSKGSNFEKGNLISISLLYQKFLAYCEKNQHSDDIIATIFRHATNKKKSYRRIIMDSIDICIRMGLIK